MRRAAKHSLIQVAGLFGAAVLIVAVLFGGNPRLPLGIAGNWIRELQAAFRDPLIQGSMVACLAVYCSGFIVLRVKGRQVHRSRSELLLAIGLGIAIARYFADFSVAARTLHMVTLLGSITLGLGVAFLNRWSGSRNRAFLVGTILLLLLVACFWQGELGVIFEYREKPRWVGPWDNPNVFGLSMGVGLVVVLGSFRGSLFSIQYRKCRVWGGGAGLLGVVAAAVLLRGLYHSFSRGAWLAAGCGIAYLLVERYVIREGEKLDSSFKIRVSNTLKGWTRCSDGLKKNFLPLAVIAAAVTLLGLWHFGHTKWHAARRAFSVGNLNDFSWRNRVAAWEGTLQMMSEKPWFGFGWNQPEPMYENYYLLPRLEESAAIQMNDYLMLGATLGIPALFCFGMYLWLSLLETPNSKLRVPSSKQPSSILDPRSSQWLSDTCRAGAIVLLVGFWFDGGLFKLATASTFWILLELGRTDVNRRGAEAQSSV